MVIKNKFNLNNIYFSSKFLHAFSGELSAGKSTLINKLLGHDVLATGIFQTTGRIYRVMHSEKMRVKAYRSGCPEPTEHSFNNIEELHTLLRNLEYRDTNDNSISQVDVLLPFFKIQVKNQSPFFFSLTSGKFLWAVL